MPNFKDDFIITVLTFYAAAITAEDDSVTGGDRAAIAFTYKTGYPFATAFSLAWFSDAGRTTSKTAPGTVTITPATPTQPVTPDDTFRNGTIAVETAAQDRTEDDLFYGRLTIHQRNFNRNTGQVV